MRETMTRSREETICGEKRRRATKIAVNAQSVLSPSFLLQPLLLFLPFTIIVFPPPPTTFVPLSIPPSPPPSIFLRGAPFRARRAGHLYWSKRSITPRHCTASRHSTAPRCIRPLAPKASARRPRHLQPSSESAPSPSEPARAYMFPGEANPTRRADHPFSLIRHRQLSLLPP